MYKKPCNNTVLGKTEFIQRHHFDEKYFLYIDFIALFSCLILNTIRLHVHP